QGLDLLPRLVLEPAAALAGDAERASHLFERARLLAGKAEAQLDHLALARGQRSQRQLDVLAAQRERGGVERRLRLLVGDEVAEHGLLVIADRLIHRAGKLHPAQTLS